MFIFQATWERSIAVANAALTIDMPLTSPSIARLFDVIPRPRHSLEKSFRRSLEHELNVRNRHEYIDFVVVEYHEENGDIYLLYLLKSLDSNDYVYASDEILKNVDVNNKDSLIVASIERNVKVINTDFKTSIRFVMMNFEVVNNSQLLFVASPLRMLEKMEKIQFRSMENIHSTIAEERKLDEIRMKFADTLRRCKKILHERCTTLSKAIEVILIFYLYNDEINSLQDSAVMDVLLEYFNGYLLMVWVLGTDYHQLKAKIKEKKPSFYARMMKVLYDFTDKENFNGLGRYMEEIFSHKQNCKEAIELWKTPSIREQYPILSSFARAAVQVPVQTPNVNVFELLQNFSHVEYNNTTAQLYKILKVRDILSS